jgi:Domain of unknown function (DUF4394)/PEP-CTERM motif
MPEFDGIPVAQTQQAPHNGGHAILQGRTMHKFLLSCGVVAALLTTLPAQAVTLYGVDEVNNLVSFDSANPGATLTSVPIAGIAGSSVLSIDVRVRDGLLYALTDDNRLFTVDPVSGASSLVAALALTGTNFAMDFNPTNANLRIVSNDNTNYVYSFTSMTLIPGINVAYGAGGPAGDPDIVAAGYLNNDNDTGTGTVLYVLDSRNDVLATQNAATGVLQQVGALGVNIGARTSFDITGVGNEAFVQSGSTLYTINLVTGAMTVVGNTDRPLFGLTAAPPVPEPATWASLLLGLAAVGAATRLRKRKPL